MWILMAWCCSTRASLATVMNTHPSISNSWRVKQAIFAPAQDVLNHDDVIKWKHFLRYCPFVRGIQRSPVNYPHKGRWRRALMFSLICVWINGWVNNREAGDLNRYHAHYDIIKMQLVSLSFLRVITQHGVYPYCLQPLEITLISSISSKSCMKDALYVNTLRPNHTFFRYFQRHSFEYFF